MPAMLDDEKECPGRMSALTLSDLQTGISREGDCGLSIDGIPPWLDREKLSRGQQFFKNHVVAITLAMHCSLVSGFSLSNLLDPLVFTEQTNTREKSIRRYLTTFSHLLHWHTGDIFSSDSKAHQSLAAVRSMHLKVARDMSTKACKRMLYVSQYDMALVQCGFMGAVVMYPEGFGIRCSVSQLEDYIYFWKCIGYLLGIEDYYNICSSEKYCQTRALCKQIEQDVLLPTMLNPPSHFDMIANAYCDGVNMFLKLPIYTKESVFGFAYQNMGVQRHTLSWKDWIRVNIYRLFVNFLWYVPWFEQKLNDFVLNGFYRMEKIRSEKENKKE